MMKWNKITALVLSGVLMVGTLAGCGGTTETATTESTTTESTTTESTETESVAMDVADMPVVSLHLPLVGTFTDEGIAEVEEAMNVVLAEKYSVQIDLNYIAIGNWTTQTNLALTTDECDIICIMNSPLASFVNNGQLVALNDYYENATDELKATFSDAEIASTTFDGNIYSLSRKWWAGQETAFFMSEAVVEALEIEPKEVDSIEEVDALLYAAKEEFPDIYALTPGVESSKLMDLWYFGDGMADERGRYGVVPIFDEDFDVNNIECKSVFATDGFMEIATYAYKWYNDGLVLPDVLSNSISGGTYIANEESFGFLVRQQGVDYKASTVLNIDYDGINDQFASAALGESTCFSNSTNVISYGISSNSANKDASWVVLQALYSDGDVSNLLTNGIEGVHYVETDGAAYFPEGIDSTTSSYGGIAQYYTFPNTLNSVPSYYMGSTFVDDMEAYNAFVEVSPIMGFQWDYAGLEDQMAAVSKVYDQYYDALISGLLDPVTTIPVIEAELEAAGMNDILESQNEQLAEFMATK